MGILQRLFAAVLPEQLPPKVPSGTFKTVPAYLGKTKGQAISNASTNTTNLILSDHVRNEATINQVIKKLVLVSPDLSHAVYTKIYTSLSKEYKVIAYDPTGRIDREATQLAQIFVQRLNLSSYDYTKFTRSTDLRSLVASLLYDSIRYGYCATELVLGEGFLPAFIKAIPSRRLTWADNAPFTYPIYKGADADVPLNFPTIMVSSSIQDEESPYTDSPMQAAIQACLWDADFVDSLRRTAMKNLFQRLTVTINSEEYIKSLPLEVSQDREKLKTHMDALTADLEAKLADLEPDDVLVLFDIIKPDIIGDANRSEDRSVQVLQGIINGKMSSGAKILPSIIGRGDSANAASTETLLFLKAIAAGQMEVCNLLSRNLSLALRLFGYEANALFTLSEVNLRPESELETFKSVRQARFLELLSLGLVDDVECSIELTGNLPPEGYKELAGTMFKSAPANIEGSNDYSNTSASTDGKTNSTQAQKDTEGGKKGVKSK